MLQASPENAMTPAWGQEVTLKMQGVLEDRTVVEKDCKLVFVIGEGDVNQVRRRQAKEGQPHTHTRTGNSGTPACILSITSHLLPAEFSIGINLCFHMLSSVCVYSRLGKRHLLADSLFSGKLVRSILFANTVLKP